MRVTGSGSVATRVNLLLEGVLAVSAILVALEIITAALLVVDPQHPVRRYFQVTTIARVSSDVWPTTGLVHVSDGSATAEVDPMAFVTFRPSSRGFVLVTLAVGLMWWACFFAVVLQLRGVCANLSSGTPFPRDNIRRVRTIGWAILGTVGVELLIDALAFAYLHGQVTVAGGPVVVPGVILWVDFPLGTAIAGLAVLVLAELFKAGADLQDEQALVI
jgi:hypothetical protein